MKKTFRFTILLLSILTSCEKKVEIPIKSKMVAKYIVFEDSISSKLIEDLKNVKEFDNKDEGDKPPFKLDGKYYKFEREYRLDSEGFLKVVNEHNYYSFDYADYGIKKDPIKDRETLGQRFSLKLSNSREKIIDCGDTLEIEKVYPKEKLIFVKQDRKDGRINIYEYK
ncbi:hypothetical protein [Flavobacterium frigidimaris]|uniref:Lipoprotein n=1 Tax=Flavobacterium frigidimaris TaxID=262320 RepID=A0ABX4BNU4_FLAFR|nr:hypothetical protein [Flavobacterium frigidimaris]OXA77659.1 hypothetical protein B0A65_15070 [Flavobacterium frigidimaris]